MAKKRTLASRYIHDPPKEDFKESTARGADIKTQDAKTSGAQDEASRQEDSGFAEQTGGTIPITQAYRGKDDETGLGLYRGIISPWDKVVAYKETYNYLFRHKALMATGFMNVLRIVEPDDRKRYKALQDTFYEAMEQMWADPGMMDFFRTRFNIPESEVAGAHMAAVFADMGDEGNLMAGRVHEFSRDRVEKELDTCPFALVGPDMCATSMGGTAFINALAAPDEIYDDLSERRGCGDMHCRVVIENKRKYGERERPEEFWESFGPSVDPVHVTPRKEMKSECEHLTTGIYHSPYGAEFTTGELFTLMGAGGGSFSMYGSVEAIRVLRDFEPDDKKVAHLIECVFGPCGKYAFGELAAVKGVRDWLGVPGDVNDSRILGAYVSMIFQARVLSWKFTEFGPDRTVIEVDEAKLTLETYPEITLAYGALFNGMAKTLISAEWVARFEEASEGTLRLIIERGHYGVKGVAEAGEEPSRL